MFVMRMVEKVNQHMVPACSVTKVDVNKTSMLHGMYSYRKQSNETSMLTHVSIFLTL